MSRLTEAQRALLREVDLHDACEVVLNVRWGRTINPGRSAYRMGWSNGRKVQSRTVEALEKAGLVKLDDVPCETRGVRITPAGRLALSEKPEEQGR
jgi:ribosomal protein S19E (S16A)